MNSFPDIVNISDGQDSFSFPKWTQTPGLTHQQCSLYKQTHQLHFQRMHPKHTARKINKQQRLHESLADPAANRKLFSPKFAWALSCMWKNYQLFPITPENNLVLVAAHPWVPACCCMISTAPLICDPICTMQISSDSSLFLSLKQTMAPVTKKEISTRRKLFSLFLCFFFFLLFNIFFLVLGLTVSNYPEIFTNLFFSQTVLLILVASPTCLI